MIRKVYSYGLLCICLALVAIIGFVAGRKTSGYDPLHRKKTTGMQKLKATLQLIEQEYVDTVNTDKLTADLIPVLMKQLDPHSNYLTAEERKKETENLEGHFFGIGVTFNFMKDTAIVLDVVPDGPSDLAGIIAGDRIVSVNDTILSGRGFTADSVRSRLKGPDQSVVRLQIRNPETGEQKEVSITRGIVNVNAVAASYMLNDSLGVIKLNGFVSNTYNDFMQAYAKLQEQGMKGLIIDLRDNLGGVLKSALLLGNEFLSNGQMIMYMEGKNVPRELFQADGTGSLQNIPLYILITESSASASEILAGAIQDNDAGIVIGRRSFGKGLVQHPFEYADGSSVHLTIARYYTPSGRSIQKEYHLGDGTKYHLDILERYKKGEFFHKDSIKLDPQLLFHTQSGRPVYGGGGITPDIFVPQDTLGYNTYTSEVFEKGALQDFSFYYADTYRNFLMGFKNAESCYQYLMKQGLPWLMAPYANRQHGIRVKKYLVAQAEKKLETILVSLILGYTYGKDAAAKSLNLSDPMMKTVAKLFHSGVRSPKDIPQEHLVLPDSLAQKTLAEADSLGYQTK